MAIEFTRLADVTAIEEVKDEDTVLVVQDGEVKRAPKTAVGGGGEWDAVIDDIRLDGNSSVSFAKGDYQTIYNKIINGEMPHVLVRYKYQYGTINIGCNRPTWCDIIQGESEYISIRIYSWYGTNMNVLLYSDGTMEQG